MRYLEGLDALFEVWTILATPGVCSIDFETYPTDPAWHGEQAALRAPRGQKGAAKEKAVLEATMHGRAAQRQACTLQLAHQSGAKVFVRLTDPSAELPAMFEGRVASLVAHSAQFETEVLLKYGVAVDIDCTLIAAKCLYLVAVPEDRPQPVRFGLADLVEREFGRVRDKTIRDRDWRNSENLDAEAVEYGLADVRDCLELWTLYRARLEQDDLLDGYRIIQGSLLPTAAINLTGLVLNTEAHTSLMSRMRKQADELERELDRICLGAIENHGSSSQVSTWILEEVLEVPVKPPTEPKVVDLIEFLRRKGGLRRDPGGELAARDLRGLIRLDGMSLEHATIAAWEAGYIGHEHSRFDDGGRPEERDLLAALDRSRFERVLTEEDQSAWDAYLEARDHFDHLHKDDDYRLSHFAMKLHAKTAGAVKGWRTTKTGHLAITKGAKSRKAEQLSEVFPTISNYLIKHAQWTKATKLLDAFGPTLRRWQDDDGRVRGQHRVYGAWTGRQSCVNPNLQNQPHETEFRALWIARPGRKLIIADYSQIELRLLAIVAGDERLREVYREGRDVHQETADVAGVPRKNAKNVNFAMAYGSGAAGLAENFGFSLDEAYAIMAKVLGAYTGLSDYRAQAPEQAASQGYIAIRPNRRVIYDQHSPGTTAINAPIQGGAASVQMRALRLVFDRLRERSDILLAASVHDEVILDSAEESAAEAAELLVDCMAKALLEVFPEAEDMGLARLTAATICDSWAEKA